MHVRYTGTDQARDLALPGGFIRFEHGQWVDLPAACDAAGIGLHHLEIIVPQLGPDWETADTPPTKRAPRKRAPRKRDADAGRARVDARLARLDKES